MPRTPRAWHNFYGQQGVIKRIRPLIAGAKSLGQALSSMLFIGPAGVGKTEMARTVTADFGSELVYCQVGAETDLAKTFDLVTHLRHGDVLFLDEVHSLRVACQEALYLAPMSERSPRLGRTRARW